MRAARSSFPYLWPCVWLAMVICIGGGILLWGAPAVFQVLGVKASEPGYADARVVTAAIESMRDGYDPLVENPRDPWGRTFNYPRVWLLLGKLIDGQQATAALALALGAAYMLGWLVFPGCRAGGAVVLAMLLVGLSPACVLGMERGNVDLLLFLLLALASWSVGRGSAGRVAAAGAVIAAFVLKLFPLAGLAVFPVSPRRQWWRVVVAVLAFAACWLALTWNDLWLVSAATPRATGMSYGRNVLWMEVAQHGERLGQIVHIMSWGGVLVAGLLFVAGWRRAPAGQTACRLAGRDVAAFRVGAAVYLGTFLLGNNWDYRLVFLLFCVPGLVGLAIEDTRELRWTARVVLAAAVLSCWHILVFRLAVGLPRVPGGPAAVLLDEAANWLVFLGLAWLLPFCRGEESGMRC